MTRSQVFAGGLFLFAAAVLAAVAIEMAGRDIGPSQFVSPAPLPVPNVARSDFYPEPPGERAAHAPTATLLPDGRIALYWFAGTREGAKDTVLRMSIFDGEKWGTRQTVVDRARTAADQHRYIKKLGNPVVFRHPNGEYWLVYVSASLGGWSSSALNLMRSPDGINWGPSKRLVSGPFLNLSTLVKAPPLFREDGLVALPAYHELATSYGKLLLLDDDGEVVDRARIGKPCQIQPWLAALGGGKAIALMRQHRCALPRLWASSTGDGGLSWSTPEATQLSNPNSPAAALTLPDGRVVAAVNDDPQVEYILSLVVSGDGGATWQRGAAIFDGTARKFEYRYPWMLQDNEGRIHVFASEAKRGIRHAILGADALMTAQ